MAACRSSSPQAAEIRVMLEILGKDELEWCKMVCDKDKRYTFVSVDDIPSGNYEALRNWLNKIIDSSAGEKASNNG